MREADFEKGRRIMKEFVDYFDKNRIPNKDWTYTYKDEKMTVLDAKARYRAYTNILKIGAATLNPCHFI